MAYGELSNYLAEASDILKRVATGQFKPWREAHPQLQRAMMDTHPESYWQRVAFEDQMVSVIYVLEAEGLTLHAWVEAPGQQESWMLDDGEWQCASREEF